MKFLDKWGTFIFWFIALIGLWHIAPAKAAEYSVKFGPGLQDDSTTGSTKIFGVRRASRMFYGVYNAVEAGGYVDGGADRKGALLVKAQLGVEPGPEVGLFSKAFVGPCYISQTDSQLGGNFQFCTDIAVGVRDSETFMTIGYGHISSAGIYYPNHGRDYMIFELGFRL